MINQLNLSSRPFRNRTLPWVLAAIGILISVFAAVFVFVEHQKVSNQTKAVKAETDEIVPKINALTAESEKIKQALTPEQRVLLSSAHSLVDRRRFSWSRLFADLESILPRNVRVANISVRDVIDQGNGRMLAELDFAVVSKDYQSVVNMLNEMNNSGKFQSVELRTQDLQRDKGNLTEYTMQLRYLPSAGTPVVSANFDVNAATTTPNKFRPEAAN